jgi:hypothetical protein
MPAILAAQGEPPRAVPRDSPGELPTPPSAEVGVTKVGETRYRLGPIEFDAKSREIRLPVVVNMREGGPTEYLLVEEKGKVHESILATSISPLHLQIVMKLLRYRSGNGDVFNRFLPEDLLGAEGGKESDRGESVVFHFSPEGGEEIPATELVVDADRADAMEPGAWVFTGSVVEEGSFLAEAEGSIIAIYLDPAAIFNMTREGADIDLRWGARTSAIPEIGTKGMLTIRPAEPAAEAPAKKAE